MSFAWASALDVGLGVIQGFTAASGAKAKAQASNDIREANNSIQRSQSMLARSIQDINNRRIMERAGQRQDTLTRQFTRLQDSQTRQGFEASIQQAEAMGQAATAASAMGAGASAINMASSVANITAGRQRAYMERAQKDQSYEALEGMAYVMGDAVRSLRNTYYVAPQDVSRDTSSSATQYLMAALTGKASSLNTLLGSLAPNQANGPVQGPPWLSPYIGVQESDTGVTVTPVKPQSRLTPEILAPITIT